MKLTWAWSVALAAGAVSLSACKDGTAGTTAAIVSSCHNAAGGACTEFTGADYKNTTIRRSCESQKATFLPGACPIESRVGACLVKKGTRAEATTRYYATFPGYGIKLSKDAVVAEGERQCKQLMKGEWTLN
jgi:hypothetical protein